MSMKKLSLFSIFVLTFFGVKDIAFAMSKKSIDEQVESVKDMIKKNDLENLQKILNSIDSQEIIKKINYIAIKFKNKNLILESIQNNNFNLTRLLLSYGVKQETSEDCFDNTLYRKNRTINDENDEKTEKIINLLLAYNSELKCIQPEVSFGDFLQERALINIIDETENKRIKKLLQNIADFKQSNNQEKDYIFNDSIDKETRLIMLHLMLYPLQQNLSKINQLSNFAEKYSTKKALSELLEESFKTYDSDIKGLFDLGIIYLRLNDFTKALNFLQSAEEKGYFKEEVISWKEIISRKIEENIKKELEKTFSKNYKDIIDDSIDLNTRLEILNTVLKHETLVHKLIDLTIDDQKNTRALAILIEKAFDKYDSNVGTIFNIGQTYMQYADNDMKMDKIHYILEEAERFFKLAKKSGYSQDLVNKELKSLAEKYFLLAEKYSDKYFDKYLLEDETQNFEFMLDLLNRSKDLGNDKAATRLMNFKVVL